MEIMDLKKINYNSDFKKIVLDFYRINDYNFKNGEKRMTFEEHIENYRLCDDCEKLIHLIFDNCYYHEGKTICEKCNDKLKTVEATNE